MRYNQIINPLSEIVAAPPHEPGIQQYQTYFTHSRLTGSFSDPSGKMNLECREATALGRILIGLFAENVLVAFLQMIEIEDCTVARYAVARILTDEQYRNRGCMRYLLDYFLHAHGTFLSDQTQTPHAKSMWQSLISIPGTMRLSVYDLQTGKQTAVAQSDPWDDNENTRILAEGKAYWTDTTLREAYLDRRRQMGRENEYYVQGCGGYYNP